MNVFACLTLATTFAIDVCIAQFGVEGPATDAVGFFSPCLSGAIDSIQSDAGYELTTTDLPSEVTSNNVQTSAATSTVSLTSSPTSATSSHSSTSSTAKPSSSISSAAKTTSSAKASATASPSHQSTAKVGIGVGVPLGISFAALIGFLLLRHRRHKEVSRRRHHGIVAAAGLYPVNEESNERSGGTDQTNTTDFENMSESQGHEKEGVHEILGTEIPAHSRELIGSPGVPRQELGMRRDSV